MVLFYLFIFFLLPPVASIQRLPAVSVMTDINFPMKGRKGMVDWARNSEDKVVVPKGIFLPQTAGTCATYTALFVQSLFPPPPPPPLL